MAIELDKAYDSSKTEDKIYQTWIDSGFFNPDNLEGPAYSIVLPPPNVTGNLHVGHALMLVIQDILIRYKRMNGFKTLWIPGTDHAAIATQSKVEKLLEKEGVRKHELGRDAFLKRVEEFAQNSHDNIVNQVKKMGSSIDWSREAYTLDDTRSKAVRVAFKNMYEQGLIYRGSRIVNWDPKLQTTVSDDEIEWKEETSQLYYLKYGPFVIATSRPETKFGDKYVVMHPADPRYKEFEHNQKIELEWINGPITATVIKDEVIDMEFGTGVMTITPWHDAVDFEIAQRHSLDKEQIIDERGKLLDVAGEFAGMKIAEARGKIMEKLQSKGLVEKIEENYIHRIATNSRGGGTIEPQIKEQWFIDVNREFSMPHSVLSGINAGDTVTLKHLMRHVVENGETKITPENYKKIYYHWIDNLRDWCISRQIWYGHRIPVWYKGSEVYCDVEAPEGEGWAQDSDTLDTWFSSGLWTFSTLAHNPSEIRLENGRMIIDSADYKTFHPTDVLETGYDILFFWVARMVLMTTYHVGQIPFKQVYLHGLIRDAGKEKMSKSKGNIIDPLDMIAKYGTDALRFALIFNTAPGTDMALAEDKIKGMKHFANKLWNISRYVLANTESTQQLNTPEAQTEADNEILAKLETVTKDTTKHIEEFRLHEAAQALYQFAWYELADIYIEASKPQLLDEKQKANTQKILLYNLYTLLKLLHPFMPFVTEEIWSKLDQKKLLLVTPWPKEKD